ncbi:MAG TPA: STAS domain-containing protein [Candidatus Kapabacteria bacterium]|jgi:anti-sigma B factor antagonist
MSEDKQTERFTVREVPTGTLATVIALSGQLDAHTALEFERFLERVVRDEGKRNLVLDFSALEYISSAGLGVLMGLIEEVRAAGGDMKLAALPEKIFHVLDLLGFPLVFRIFPTVQEAENAFTE